MERNVAAIFRALFSRRSEPTESRSPAAKISRRKKIRTIGDIPSPRSGHVAVSDGACMYVYGGYNKDGDEEMVFPEMYRFHFLTATWEKLPMLGPAPTATCSQSAVLIGKEIIMFGGTGLPFGLHNDNDIHVFDISSQSWRLVEPEGDLRPVGRFGQSVVYDSKRHSLWMYGGTEGLEFHNDVWVFDLSKKQWKQIHTENPPAARFVPKTQLNDEKSFLKDIAIRLCFTATACTLLAVGRQNHGLNKTSAK